MSLPSGSESKPLTQTEPLDAARLGDSSVSSDSTKSEKIKEAVPWLIFGVIIVFILIIFVPNIPNFFRKKLPKKEELSEAEKEKAK